MALIRKIDAASRIRTLFCFASNSNGLSEIKLINLTV